MARLRDKPTPAIGLAHPWVVGKDEVSKYLTVVEECAKSWLAIGEGRY
jgi:hypothetical protein